ncbi:hypothetical protein HY375_02810 [Candidatus Berkelbacteria bacterium]|nr:hypothetical protein [Candidatus Berkelbacteria bacterium]
MNKMERVGLAAQEAFWTARLDTLERPFRAELDTEEMVTTASRARGSARLVRTGFRIVSLEDYEAEYLEFGLDREEQLT